MKRLKKYIGKFGFKGFLLYLARKIKWPETVTVGLGLAGTDTKIRLRSFSSDIDVFEQIFIDEDYRFDVNFEPKTIVDAGANIGLSAIYFALAFPGADIMALEPESTNYELLETNTEEFPHITPIKKGLWYKNSRLNITNPDEAKFSFSLEENDKSPDAVDGVTVDSLIQEHGLETIDILKIDIEGAEKEVFAEKPAWLSRVKIIFIELHDSKKIGCSRAFYTAVDPYVKEELRQGENVVVIMEN
ncbi:MAG: FkbM family methyltransferase [Desulfarculaceae bacterium]|nr:FkbM family methyltransferase [Desulfarculaceae bacterium]